MTTKLIKDMSPEEFKKAHEEAQRRAAEIVKQQANGTYQYKYIMQKEKPNPWRDFKKGLLDGLSI